jgi:hypothetical protein
VLDGRRKKEKKGGVSCSERNDTILTVMIYSEVYQSLFVPRFIQSKECYDSIDDPTTGNSTTQNLNTYALLDAAHIGTHTIKNATRYAIKIAIHAALDPSFWTNPRSLDGPRQSTVG